MENSIQILEKPDWVSWDDIHEVLFRAHAQNRANGINMRKPTLPGEVIAKEIGTSGKMFVAMDGRHVVGTLALIKKEGKQWYNAGDYGYLCFGAVLPEYGGKGIYRSLYKLAEDTARAMGLNVLTRDTNERNARMLKITKKEGYHFVAIKACKDHFNIVRAKWLIVVPMGIGISNSGLYIPKGKPNLSIGWIRRRGERIDLIFGNEYTTHHCNRE